jgi:PAS domain S-box-containing protein
MGALVLLGWAVGVAPLAGAAPGYAAMKPNSAVCFLALGVALALLRPATISTPRRVLGRCVAAGAGTIAILTLIEYVLGVDLGLDRMLFTRAVGAIATPHVGRMAPNSAVCFVLAAGALACLDARAAWRVWAGPVLSLLVAIVAGSVLVGYLSNVTSLTAGAHTARMAMPSTFGFLVLGTGIICARPGHGPLRLLTSDTVGGTVLRFLFPTAIAVPVALGVLRVAGQAAGLYDTDTGVWLLVLSIIGLLVPLTWALGASLDRAERERRCSEAVSHEAQRDLVAFENAPIGSVITGADGRVERVNQAFCRMIGYAPDELLGVHHLEITHPDDRAASAVLVAALLSGGPSTERMEKRYVHRSGRAIEARVAITAIFDENREVAQFFVQIEDITEASRTRRELEEAQFEMLARLTAAAEFHDDNTGQHTRRVGDVSVTIARRLGLPCEQVDLIGRAAPLHDVGKIAIPDAILGKSGRLTCPEFEQMKTHTTIGAQMLAGSAFALLEMAEEIALTHHERWDGTGYPAGLEGDAIPIAGRIVAVADVFDALTHERPYKEAWSEDDALAEMAAQSGRQFDPQVLDAFLAVKRVPAGVCHAS